MDEIIYNKIVENTKMSYCVIGSKVRTNVSIILDEGIWRVQRKGMIYSVCISHSTTDVVNSFAEKSQNLTYLSRALGLPSCTSRSGGQTIFIDMICVCACKLEK